MLYLIGNPEDRFSHGAAHMHSGESTLQDDNLPILLISRESAIDLLSFTAMALAKFAMVTILLHSVYFFFASLSLGRTFVTYRENQKEIRPYKIK